MGFVNKLDLTHYCFKHFWKTQNSICLGFSLFHNHQKVSEIRIEFHHIQGMVSSSHNYISIVIIN